MRWRGLCVKHKTGTANAAKNGVYGTVLEIYGTRINALIIHGVYLFCSVHFVDSSKFFYTRNIDMTPHRSGSHKTMLGKIDLTI